MSAIMLFFRRKILRLLVWFLVRFLCEVVSLDRLHYRISDPLVSAKMRKQIFWNTYEEKERRAILRHVPSTLPIIEAGGCLGATSCLANRLLVNPRLHIVLEANPAILPLLAENKARNRCQFSIVHGALSPRKEENLLVERDAFASRTGDSGIPVPSFSLQGLLQKLDWPRCVLILDIEGGEKAIVEEEGETMKEHVAMLILETHTGIYGSFEERAILKQLDNLGLKVKEKDGDVYVLYNHNLL